MIEFSECICTEVQAPSWLMALLLAYLLKYEFNFTAIWSACQQLTDVYFKVQRSSIAQVQYSDIILPDTEIIPH